MTMKVVLRVEVRDEKEKQKALEKVASLPGIDYLGMDLKEQKLTVVGKVDAIQVCDKLRKYWCTRILSAVPVSIARTSDDKNRKNGGHASIARKHDDRNGKINGGHVSIARKHDDRNQLVLKKITQANKQILEKKREDNDKIARRAHDQKNRDDGKKNELRLRVDVYHHLRPSK